MLVFSSVRAVKVRDFAVALRQFRRVFPIVRWWFGRRFLAVIGLASNVVPPSTVDVCSVSGVGSAVLEEFKLLTMMTSFLVLVVSWVQIEAADLTWRPFTFRGRYFSQFFKLGIGG
ncbi:unnamed protein product [Thlaspi arvense]|uniref:Uncharacterized protein n=1 Tax=Thlaspi arvense TaxID=13288 RepID=A0AAU9RA57_THLAR|nr:unnamed protein product [Thlaspi arvense]